MRLFGSDVFTVGLVKELPGLLPPSPPPDSLPAAFSFLSGHGLFQCIYHSEIDFCSFLHCHKRPGTSLEFPFPFYIVIRQPLSFEPFFSPSQEKRKSEREGGGGQRKISSLRWAWSHLCVAGFFVSSEEVLNLLSDGGTQLCSAWITTLKSPEAREMVL